MATLRIDPSQLTVDRIGEQLVIKAAAELVENVDGLSISVEGVQFQVRLRLANVQIDQRLAAHGQLNAEVGADLSNMELEVTATHEGQETVQSIPVPMGKILEAIAGEKEEARAAAQTKRERAILAYLRQGIETRIIEIEADAQQEITRVKEVAQQKLARVKADALRRIQREQLAAQSRVDVEIGKREALEQKIANESRAAEEAVRRAEEERLKAEQSVELGVERTKAEAHLRSMFDKMNGKEIRFPGNLLRGSDSDGLSQDDLNECYKYLNECPFTDIIVPLLENLSSRGLKYLVDGLSIYHERPWAKVLATRGFAETPEHFMKKIPDFISAPWVPELLKEIVFEPNYQAQLKAVLGNLDQFKHQPWAEGVIHMFITLGVDIDPFEEQIKTCPWAVTIMEEAKKIKDENERKKEDQEQQDEAEKVAAERSLTPEQRVALWEKGKGFTPPDIDTVKETALHNPSNFVRNCKKYIENGVPYIAEALLELTDTEASGILIFLGGYVKLPRRKEIITKAALKSPGALCSTLNTIPGYRERFSDQWFGELVYEIAKKDPSTINEHARVLKHYPWYPSVQQKLASEGIRIKFGVMWW